MYVSPTMFVKLYWLGAGLTLMPLSIQPHEVYGQNLFPFVLLNINGNTFLYDSKKSSNSTQLNCGNIIIKSGETSFDMIGWTYNIKWNNAKEDRTRIFLNNMDYPLPETPDECHDETENF
uniref:Fimbrial protein n=1 Tax=Strongyloides venezuelensis TaxID=75913 RepID=A0A0K0G0A1_STRVS